MFVTRCIRHVDGHLAIVNLAESPAPLPCHAHRLGPFLGEGRRIEYDYAIGLAYVFADLYGQGLQQRCIFPRNLPNKLLETLSLLIEQVSDPFTGFVLKLGKKSGQVFDGVTLLFGFVESRPERLNKVLQTGEEPIDQVRSHFCLS